MRRKSVEYAIASLTEYFYGALDAKYSCVSVLIDLKKKPLTPLTMRYYLEKCTVTVSEGYHLS